MSRAISGKTVVAGVVGHPVRHSLSPLLYNAWLEAAGIDGVYVAFSPPEGGFAAFAAGMRGGVVRGFNVTVPFKEQALAFADTASAAARRAGAANLLIFEDDGAVAADSTDGAGLMGAIARQAPRFDPAQAPAVVLGAGGAARSAVAALIDAGAPQVRIVNRTTGRAQALARAFSGAAVVADTQAAAQGAGLIVNATTLGLGGGDGPDIPLERLASGAVVMDMVYRPLRTGLLTRAEAAGLTTVDGLEMLIRQAAPSFEALFGTPPPDIDVRRLALKALETGA